MNSFLHTNCCCDPSVECSCRDGSNKGSQHVFLLKNKKLSFNYPQYSLLNGTVYRFELTCNWLAAYDKHLVFLKQ